MSGLGQGSTRRQPGSDTIHFHDI